MKKTFLIVAALVSFTTFAFAADFEITIDVAPNVLNLQRIDDKWVTVHTDIAFTKVDRSSVTLNTKEGSIPIEICKSDDLGNFVAKFSWELVSQIVESGDYNTFRLTGRNDFDEIFSGTQDIWVVNNIPPGR